jgi:hypothetical protein
MSIHSRTTGLTPLDEVRLRTWVFGAPHFEELCKVRDSIHSPELKDLSPSALEKATAYLNEVITGITNKAVGALSAAAFFGGIAAQIYLADNAAHKPLVTITGIAAFFIFAWAAMLFASCLWVAWWKDSRHFFEAHANFDSTLLLSVGRARRFTRGLMLLFLGIAMLLLSIAAITYHKMTVAEKAACACTLIQQAT